MSNSETTTIIIPANVDAALVTGPADSLLRSVQSRFKAHINVRGDEIRIEGDEAEVK